MRAARAAAFFALSTPTVATGTPGGICAIASNASRPSSTLSRERSGTPITGRSVCAATAPGRAAARPAPAISTRIPRSRAVRAYSATASGLRCAERTSNSYAMPRDWSSSSAGCIASRSDSEPTSKPTIGPSAADMALRGPEGDVVPVAHAAEGNQARRLVGARPRGPNVFAGRGHGEDAPAVGDELATVPRRPCVEDERAGRLGVLDAGDRRPAVAPLRVGAAGKHDRDGGFVAERDVAGQLPGRRAEEQRQEVAVYPRQDRLRLGIAEPAVELEHPRAVFRQHQAGVQQAGEGRIATSELREDRPVDRLKQFLDLRLAQPGHRRIRAHAARVGPRVAVT